MFKKGDKVVCVEGNDENLIEGQEYIVQGVIDEAVGDAYAFLVLEDNCVDYAYEDRGWFAYRFKLVQEAGNV